MGSAPIFCVGQIRTGTTTFGDACEILGFTRRSWATGKAVVPGSHKLMVDGWFARNMDPLYEVAESYDVLDDLPWSLVYRKMAEHFPDAKFVLTTRKSTERWFRSVVRHQQSMKKPYWVHAAIFGANQATIDPDGYKSTYNNHLRDVRQYFAGNERFLEVCWESGDGWPELCGFLGRPVPNVPFPHSNASPTSPGLLRSSLSRTRRVIVRR